jgi:hypothetical protein
MSIVLTGIGVLTVATVLVLTMTKRGRNFLRRVMFARYRETDADASLKRAVLTFAERTASSQNPDRVDIGTMNRSMRSFIVALVPLLNLSEAKQDYFYEVGWEHAMRKLKDVERPDNQAGQVRHIRKQ